MRAPGFYDDIPEADYHADRESLSVSGAKTMLKAPALFKYEQENPVHKDVFDFGSAAHALVLGAGMESIYVSPLEEFRTKDARAEKAAAQAEGLSIITPADWLKVCDMADVLSSHKLAMALLSDGKPEVSAYAPDEPTGIMRRCRFDWLRDDLGVDYKSCATSDPVGFAKACASFGYHQQAPWYLDVADTLGKPLRGFVFIAQMKTPPYLVGVYELEPDALAVGRGLNRRALERFRDCRETGIWPGFVREDQITPIDIPRWAYYDNQETA